jgi:hypothetical protein
MINNYDKCKDDYILDTKLHHRKLQWFIAWVASSYVHTEYKSTEIMKNMQQFVDECYGKRPMKPTQ